MSTWTFRALDFTIAVASGIAAFAERLDALLGGYEQIPRGSYLLYRYALSDEGNGCYQLLRNDELCYQGDNTEELLDFFQIELYRRIVENSHRRWLLHAAALCQGTRVLVLAGPSDAGKSTLCRALMARGWTYLSEEIVSLGANNIDALRRPLHLEAPEQVADLPTDQGPVLLRESPSPIWIAKAPPWPPSLGLEDLRVAAILRVQYRPDEPTKLRLLGDAEARQELWPCRMNSNVEVAQLASRVIAKTPCYRLDIADRESALSALNGIARE